MVIRAAIQIVVDLEAEVRVTIDAKLDPGVEVEVEIEGKGRLRIQAARLIEKPMIRIKMRVEAEAGVLIEIKDHPQSKKEIFKYLRKEKFFKLNFSNRRSSSSSSSSSSPQ